MYNNNYRWRTDNGVIILVVYIGLKTENKIEYVTNKDGTILGFNNTKVAKKFLLRIGLTPMEIMNYEFIESK
jgi:hypothetical protein